MSSPCASPKVSSTSRSPHVVVPQRSVRPTTSAGELIATLRGHAARRVVLWEQDGHLPQPHRGPRPSDSVGAAAEEVRRATEDEWQTRLHLPAARLPHRAIPALPTATVGRQGCNVPNAVVSTSASGGSPCLSDRLNSSLVPVRFDPTTMPVRRPHRHRRCHLRLRVDAGVERRHLRPRCTWPTVRHRPHAAPGLRRRRRRVRGLPSDRPRRRPRRSAPEWQCTAIRPAAGSPR